MTELTSRQKKLTSALSRYSIPASVRDRPAWIRNLLYGDYKIGKTITAASCGERPLIFAIGNGWASLKDWPNLMDRVTVDEFQSMKHFELFVSALLEDLPKYREFDHLIIDPFSVLVQYYIGWLQTNAVPSTQDARVHWSRNIKGDDEEFESFTTAGMGDFNATLAYFRKYMIPLFTIKKHVTLIAHVREPSFTAKPHEVNANKAVRAALPGQTHGMIAQAVNLISYMKANWPRQTISFKPTDREDGGSHFRELQGKTILASEFPSIYKKWSTENV